MGVDITLSDITGQQAQQQIKPDITPIPKPQTSNNDFFSGGGMDKINNILGQVNGILENIAKIRNSATNLKGTPQEVKMEVKQEQQKPADMMIKEVRPKVVVTLDYEKLFNEIDTYLKEKYDTKNDSKTIGDLKSQYETWKPIVQSKIKEYLESRYTEFLVVQEIWQ